MIRNSREKVAWAYRTLRECPSPVKENVEITLFANYYGTLKESHRFNDAILYTDKNLWSRAKKEIRETILFRRSGKHENR